MIKVILLTLVVIFSNGKLYANPVNTKIVQNNKKTEVIDITKDEDPINMVKEGAEEFSPLSPLPEIIEKLLPTVVTITAVKDKNYIDTEEGIYEENYDKSPKILGSGFIITDDGYIVTNNHVVENSDNIYVSLKGSNAQFQADIVGVDKETDLALLKIEIKTKLPFAEFDTNPNYNIGDSVIVVGNPYNLGLSVSTGIISALNRDLQMGTYNNFIQTDAAINRGNSGGPMFSMNGKVIGVTSAIYSPTGTSIGIGFAVPVLDVISVVEELKKYGYVRRGWIGVTGVEMDKEIFRTLNLKRKSGMLVTDIVKDSPAEKSGLKVSDIIISYEGRPIKKMKDLSQFINTLKIGSRTNLSVIRNNKIIDLKVIVEESKEYNKYNSEEESIVTNAFEIFDMYVVPINKVVKRYFNIDRDFGLYVLKVKKGGTAFKKGIKAKDLILYVNQTPILDQKTISNTTETSKSLGLDNVFFIMEKSNGTTTVTLMPISTLDESNKKLNL